MIRYFCDSCQEEIKDLNELGNFKIQERTLSFLKHQPQGQIKVREYLFCVSCARKLLESLKEIKKQENA